MAYVAVVSTAEGVAVVVVVVRHDDMLTFDI